MGHGHSGIAGLTPATFLRDYWQKKPLLLRAALPGLVSPLSPRELLALACRADVLPRLILEEAGAYPWELLTGPFEPGELDGLPEQGWTILVGDVDRHVPAVADLLTPFRFLPNWRVDDVQVSYAPAGGSAGPHVDNYDVFLVQGYGRRRWQISHTPAPDDVRLVPDADVAILEEFRPDVTWVLSPGDVLYLPPRIPHWGVAVDACMTYSVGFRAPAPSDILYGLLEGAAGAAAADARFCDPGRAPAAHPGRIEAADLDWVRQVARRHLPSDDDLAHWFGRYITRPADQPAPRAEPLRAADLRRLLGAGCMLRRVAVGMFAHVEGARGTHLYAGGRAYFFEVDHTPAVRLLTGIQPLTSKSLKPYLARPAFIRLLVELINRGCLTVQRV